MMDDKQEARNDFESGRGEQLFSSHNYQDEYRRLAAEKERTRQRAIEDGFPARPSGPSTPLTIGGAVATVVLLAAGYFAISIASGNGRAMAPQIFFIGSWLMLIAAAFVVPFVTISLTRGLTGLDRVEARSARFKAFLTLGIGLGLARLLNAAMPIGMRILVAALVSAALAYLLSRMLPLRTAVILAVISTAAVVVIDMVGAILLFGLLATPSLP